MKILTQYFKPGKVYKINTDKYSGSFQMRENWHVIVILSVDDYSVSFKILKDDDCRGFPGHTREWDQDDLYELDEDLYILVANSETEWKAGIFIDGLSQTRCKYDRLKEMLNM